MLERIYDGGHVNLVEGEIERARVLADLGRPEEAERGLNRAIEMGRELLGAEHLLVGNALISLGRLRADRGDLGAGIAAVQEGLRYREAAFGASSPRLVDSLLTYAHLLERAGRGDEAAATLERARSAAETGLGAGHPTAVRTMASLAGLTWRRGRAGAALGLAREASLAVERELRGTVGHLPERQALGYLARRETPETVLFSGLLHDEPRRAEWLRAAWDWTLRTRGLVLDELSERHRAGIAAESAEVGKAWERVAETRRRLALLWARGPGGDDEAYAAAVRLAQEEKESAETALSRASERFRREQALQSTTLDDVAGALPEDSALVEIVRVGVAPAGAGRSVSRDLALVMQPGGVLTWRDLGPSDRVDGAVRAWRDELSRSAPDGRAGRLDALEAAGAALRSLVWDPIEDALGDEPETVFLVPDGPLHVVDLAALPAADGSFLAESGPWFHLLGSARDLVRHRGTAGPAGSTVLAVGGPGGHQPEVERRVLLVDGHAAKPVGDRAVLLLGARPRPRSSHRLGRARRPTLATAAIRSARRAGILCPRPSVRSGGSPACSATTATSVSWSEGRRPSERSATRSSMPGSSTSRPTASSWRIAAAGPARTAPSTERIRSCSAGSCWQGRIAANGPRRATTTASSPPRSWRRWI